jgi:hypothetical protein
LQGAEPRSTEQTLAWLENYWKKASEVGNKTAIEKEQTSSGIKDKFQEFFLAKIYDSYKRRRGENRQIALNTFMRKLFTDSERRRERPTDTTEPSPNEEPMLPEGPEPLIPEDFFKEFINPAFRLKGTFFEPPMPGLHLPSSSLDRSGSSL